MAVKKRGLGRGLDALLSGPTVSSLEEQAVKVDQSELQHLPLDLIQRGKYQPRRDMDPQALEELANSIKSQGVMQPIVVRPIADNRYEIIAGERRWRASQQAGKDTIPAMVKDVIGVQLADALDPQWVIGVFRRVNRDVFTGTQLGNRAAGGRGEARPLSEKDRWIAAQVGPTLREKGLLFVGLDVIKDALASGKGVVGIFRVNSPKRRTPRSMAKRMKSR